MGGGQDKTEVDSLVMTITQPAAVCFTVQVLLSSLA